MSRVRSSGSVIERTLGKALWAAGVRYRKQYRKIPGRPDFVVVHAKIAIFCDSSFWHGRDWPQASKKFKSNRGFWIRKIKRNIVRDCEVNDALKKLGWKVLRFWDDEITTSTEKCVSRVRLELRKHAQRGTDDTKHCHRLFLRRGRNDKRVNSRWVSRTRRG